MFNSPTDEIRAVRHELASRLDNDVRRIGDDLRRQQRESGREYIRLPSRAPRKIPAAGEIPPCEEEHVR